MAEWILEGDIKACFDRISHDWLLANIPTEKNHTEEVAKKPGLWNNGVLHPTDEGTPQGGIISPVFSEHGSGRFGKGSYRTIPHHS